MLPTLSRLSVRYGPGSRLRHRCSSRYLQISPLHREFHFPLPPSSEVVSSAIPQLSRGISHSTCHAACAPFTPSNSEQHSPPPYYRGCWHGVSRGFLWWYRQIPLIFAGRRSSHLTGVYDPRAFIPTRRRWVRVSPIAQDSPLLPPVGVGTVSQFPCGWSSSQTSYPSSPW